MKKLIITFFLLFTNIGIYTCIPTEIDIYGENYQALQHAERKELLENISYEDWEQKILTDIAAWKLPNLREDFLLNQLRDQFWIKYRKNDIQACINLVFIYAHIYLEISDGEDLEDGPITNQKIAHSFRQFLDQEIGLTTMDIDLFMNDIQAQKETSAIPRLITNALK